jgi:MMP 1-O-methyltransferase
VAAVSDFAPVKELIKDVPGWLSDEEGEALYELARRCTGRGVIVEIGSWKGKSTICLGRGSRAGNGVRIFAVDPHADYRHGEFKENIERAGIADLVTPVKGLSQEVVEDFDEQIELLFVDGSHEEEDVRHDFDTWVPKVVEGGVVAFHDTTWHDGVRRVMAEKVYGSRQFKDVRFVIGSTTVARKVAANTPLDRLRARRVQATKAVFGAVTRVLKKKRSWLPTSVEQAGRRVFKLVGR